MLVVTSNSNARPTSKSSVLLNTESALRLNVMNVSEYQPRFSFRGMIRGDGGHGKQTAPSARRGESMRETSLLVRLRGTLLHHANQAVDGDHRTGGRRLCIPV